MIFCFRASEKRKTTVMSKSKGKGMNFIPIIIVLVFLSYGSSLLSSVARIPLDMAKAFLTGEQYTGRLEEVINEYGHISTGITYTMAEGTPGFIPANRLSDLTLDYFSHVDQVVLMDDAGGTFWFTYEELAIAYIVLLVTFFVIRLAVSLLLSLVPLVSGSNTQVVRNGKMAMTLLLKPIRLLIFGYVLVVFCQHRIFGYEDEQDILTILLTAYGFYFLMMMLWRVHNARKYWKVQPEMHKSTTRYENTASVLDGTATVLDPTTKHDNDLIQREKRTFKHATSRYK